MWLLLLHVWWTALLAVLGLAAVVLPATWLRDRLAPQRDRLARTGDGTRGHDGP